MSGEGEPWTSRFRPKSLKDLADNATAVNQLVNWIRSWRGGVPEKRAAFLHGPPGVGKTSAVVALANDLGFDVIEVNASDYRTGKRLEALIGRSASQSLTITGRRRLILFDEMEGISGREDEGGIAEIARIIKETRNPVILVATSVSEAWEEKFAPLRDLSMIIEFEPTPFKEVVERLRNILDEMGIETESEALEFIAERSYGDLRSAVNDLEVVARGRSRLTLEDTDVLGKRDRQSYTPDALTRIFSSKSVQEARQVVSSTFIGYDDLFEWIYENLPYVLDDRKDLSDALDSLAMADIFENKAKRTQDYRLLKYMFTRMTGGVALSRRSSEGTGLQRQVRMRLLSSGLPPSSFTMNDSPRGISVKPLRYLGDSWGRVNLALRKLGGHWTRSPGLWVIPYFRPPQLRWRLARTWSKRQLRRSLAEKVSTRSHISTKEAVREVIPLMKIMFQGSEGMAKEISDWLGLIEKEEKWLLSE